MTVGTNHKTAGASDVVAHVRVVTGAGGGPDKTILNSPRFLEGFGYQAVCAYMHPPGDPGFTVLQDKAQELGATLVSIPDSGVWDLRVLPRLWHLCRQHRVTIWHAHDYKSNLLGLMLRTVWPMKLVTTVHGWVSTAGRSPLYYRIDRRCLRYYEQIICVSQDLYDECLACGVAADQCTLVHNAIDTDCYARRICTADAKRQQGISPDRLVIGAVGRLAAEKGFDRLILAVDQLLNRNLNLELIIIGEGEERPGLESLIARLGRQDRIRLLGYQTDAASLYQAMEVFALSSLREGLPNVLLEALATEVPVVATKVAGVPQLIQHEQNGILVDPDNVDQLASALQRVISDPLLRERLAIAGRRVVEEKYSFTVRMQKIAAIYDRLLGRAEPAVQETAVACQPN